jgi:hypothetical protein
MHRVLLVFAAVMAGAIQTMSGDTFTVTTTADDGAGSLRAAIQAANANSGADDIAFNIPGSGVRTINLLSALPPITGGGIIDGYTQPGSAPNSLVVGGNAVLLIQIRGNQSKSTNGLVVSAGGVIIRGLVIGGFTGAGVSLENTGGITVVEGCFIGTDTTGMSADTTNVNGGGVRVAGSAFLTTIGGSDASKRNVIVGSTSPAVFVDANTSSLIRGNYIGVNAAGTAALGKGGIRLASSDNLVGGTSVALRNVISCLGWPGVSIFGTSTFANQNILVGNYIGVTADGMSALEQDKVGVFILDGSRNRIGGSDAEDGLSDGVVGARNVIVAKGAGIQIAAVSTQPADNAIRGNFFGTAVDGATPLPSSAPNSGSAIQLFNAIRTFVGGTMFGSHNILAHYFRGLEITASSAGAGGGNTIQGNYIGTNPNGATTLGNTEGIYLGPLSNGNIIGGQTSDHGNVIGYCQTGIVLDSDNHVVQSNFIGVSRIGIARPISATGISISGSGNQISGNRVWSTGADGVAVGSSGRRNAIVSNSISNNGSGPGDLGIDLGGDGLTPNDPGDADTGANDLQNHPVLTSAKVSGNLVTLMGRLHSKPASTYRLEFFSNAVTPRFSEGNAFIGTTQVTTDADGNAQFATTFGASSPRIYSATATDSEGNTSEFGGLPDRLLNISTRLPVQRGDNALIGGFIITGSANKRVLLRAIGPSLDPLFTEPVLSDPTLELFQGNTLLTSNDDWRESQQTEIENTGIPPSNDLESAIVRDLTPGAYTAIVRGKNEATGTGLVEAYDLGRGTDARLGNIATRGFVQTGDNVMIAGFIVGGESGRGTRVIVRGLGPSLTGFGVPNALENPTLQLIDGFGTVVASNDNWRDSQESEIQMSGLAPSKDNEAAILAAVPAGHYTAVVRGPNDTTGVALVEVYHLD